MPTCLIELLYFRFGTLRLYNSFQKPWAIGRRSSFRSSLKNTRFIAALRPCATSIPPRKIYTSTEPSNEIRAVQKPHLGIARQLQTATLTPKNEERTHGQHLLSYFILIKLKTAIRIRG